MIRQLTPEDAEQALSLGREMHADSRFARLPFDTDKARRWAQSFTAGLPYLAIGLFSGTELVGMIIGVVGQTYPFTSATVACQNLLYVKPENRTPGAAVFLIRGFIKAAKQLGAEDIVFSNGTGYQPDRVGRLFERCGLRKVGGMYAMGV